MRSRHNKYVFISKLWCNDNVVFSNGLLVLDVQLDQKDPGTGMLAVKVLEV